MVISGFSALKDRLQNLPSKAAVVAAAHDEHTLQAVFAARRDGLIRPILVGRRGYPVHRPGPGGGAGPRPGGGRGG